jgi:hypothetical protein
MTVLAECHLFMCYVRAPELSQPKRDMLASASEAIKARPRTL